MKTFTKFAKSLGLIAVGALALFALPYSASANSGVTFQGRIMKPDGSPLSGVNTQFRLQLRTPDSQNCLFYEEVQMLNLSDTEGAFSLTINDGTGTRTDSTGLTLDRIFANRGTFNLNSTTCTTGTGVYSPNSSDGRNLLVYFKDETMSTWEPIPAQKINFVPFAFESKQIQGYTADSLVRVVNSSGDPVTGLSPLSNTQYTELLALIAGTSTRFEKPGQLGGVSLPTLGVGQAGQALSWTGTGWTTSTPTATVGADSVSSSNIVNGSITGADLATNIAISTTSTISTSGTVTSNITTARDFRIYDLDVAPNENYISFKAPASLSTNYNYTWPADYGTANQVLTTDGAGVLTWAAPAAASQWSNGAASAIYYNTGNVGIGTTAPGSKLTVAGQDAGVRFTVVNESATAARFPGISIRNYGFPGGSTGYPDLTLLNADGTFNAPLTVPSGTSLGRIQFTGYDGTAYPTSPPAAIVATTEEAFTASAHGTALRFNTTPTGSTTVAERLRISGSGNVGIGMTAPSARLNIMAGTATAGTAPLKFTRGVLLGTEEDGAMEFDPSGLWFTIGSTRYLIPLQTVAGNYSNVQTIGNTTGSITMTPLAGNSVIVNSAAVSNSSTTGALIVNGGVGVAGAINSAGNISSGGTVSATNNVVTPQLYGSTAASGDIRIDGTSDATKGNVLLASQGGNVGIGTTSPAYKLDVSGTLRVEAASSHPATSGSQTGNAVRLTNTVGNTVLDMGTNNTATTGWIQATHKTNSSNNYTLLLNPNGGNVGMGTLAPNYRLQIGSQSTASAVNAIALGKADIASETNLPMVQQRSILTPATSNDLALGATSTAGGILFYTGWAGGTEPLVLGANSNAARMSILPGGNVGIGTTAPNSKLEVSGAIAAQPGTSTAPGYTFQGYTTSGISAPSGQLQFLVAGSTKVAIGTSGMWGSANHSPYMALTGTPSATNVAYSFLSDTDTGIYSELDDTIRFSTAGTHRMSISSTGSVGIGTTNPSAPLHIVAADATMKLQATTSYAGQNVYDSAGTLAASFQYGNSGVAVFNDQFFIASRKSTTPLAFGTYDASASANGYVSERMRISPAGSVGIGTTAPNASYKLDVAGAVNATALKINGVDVSAGGGTVLAANGSVSAPGLSFANDPNTGFYKNTNNDDAIQITIGGLDAGQFNTSEFSFFRPVLVGNGGSAATPDYGIISNSSTGTGMFAPAANVLAFSTNSGERLRVSAAGNVGIGTTNPGYKLDVAGAVNATSLKINGVDVSTGGGTPGGSTTQVQFNSSGAFAGDASLIWDNTNKRLSVGTALPSQKLTVSEGSGESIIGGRAFMGGWSGGSVEAAFGHYYNIGSNTNYALRQSDVGRTVLNSASGNEIQFAIANNEMMRLSSAGSVGIGTTAPSTKLHVAGSVRIVDGNQSSGYVLTSDASGNATWSLPGLTATTNTAYSPVGAASTSPSSTAMLIENSSTTASTAALLRLKVNGGGVGQRAYIGANSAASGNAPSIVFGQQTSPTAYAESMRIESTGSVGIGTTAPNASYKLDVAGIVNATEFRVNGVALSAGAGDVKADGSVTMTGSFILKDGTAASPSTGFASDTTTGLYRAGSGTIGVATAGVSAFRVLSGASSAYLTAGKWRGATGTATNTTYGFENDTTGGLYGGTLSAVGIATANTSRIHVLSTGEVGIGTTTPSYSVSLGGESAQTLSMQRRTVANTAGNNLTIQAGGATVGATDKSGGNLILSAGASTGASIGTTKISFMVPKNNNGGGTADRAPEEVVTLDYNYTNTPRMNLGNPINGMSGMNVGIENADVYASTGTGRGVAAAGRTGYQAMNDSWTDGSFSYYEMWAANTNGNPQVGYVATVSTTGAGVHTPSMVFGVSTSATAHAERMRITSAGNLAIGQTTASEKLEVSGNVKATSFISTSDRRLKTDIQESSGLDLIGQLQGVSWKWKKDGTSDAGVIAQSVEKVYPLAVVTDPTTGLKSVKYNALIAPLIQSTNELHRMCVAEKEVNQHQSREIASLKEENEELKQMLLQMKKRLDTIEAKIK